MELIFIRHAHAGERVFGGRDRYRPLSERGQEQARLLAEVLSNFNIVDIQSSPASRCVQTVAPLAAAHGLTVTDDEALWETATSDEVTDCLDRALAITGTGDHPAAGVGQPQAVVLCSHGNIIPAVVEAAATRGAEITGRGCERGSVWIVSYDGTNAVSARYLSPRRGYQGEGTVPG